MTPRCAQVFSEAGDLDLAALLFASAARAAKTTGSAPKGTAATVLKVAKVARQERAAN